MGKEEMNIPKNRELTEKELNKWCEDYKKETGEFPSIHIIPASKEKIEARNQSALKRFLSDFTLPFKVYAIVNSTINDSLLEHIGVFLSEEEAEKEIEGYDKLSVRELEINIK